MMQMVLGVENRLWIPSMVGSHDEAMTHWRSALLVAVDDEDYQGASQLRQLDDECLRLPC